MDYGKYLYEQTKRQREARKSQRTTEIKEIRLRPKTNDYHLGFKTKSVRRFLGEGAKVKVRVIFRGREVTHADLGREILESVAAQLQDVGTVEQPPRMEGRSMLMILAPSK
jgi:translation initiation factor IF-3